MVMGDNSLLRGHGFESLRRILDGQFSQNKQKEAAVGPFEKLSMPPCLNVPCL